MKALKIISAVLGIALAGSASAQDYPTRPIRLVIPFAAGTSSNDIIGRALTERLTKTLGQAIVVDNKPGASGQIGSDFVAKAVPDGYTLLLATSSAQVVPPLLNKPNYDVLRDLVPVAILADVPFLMVVNPSVPAKNLAELVALAKAQPATYPFASTGIGDPTHLCLELLKRSAQMGLIHVPYKSGASAITSVISGETAAMFGGAVAFSQPIGSGTLRAIATAAPKRLAKFPDTPTFAEQGFSGFEVSAWIGLMAPAKTPPAIVKRLEEASAEAMRDPEFLSHLTNYSAAEKFMRSGEFGEYLRAEISRWRKLIEDVGIKTAG